MTAAVLLIVALCLAAAVLILAAVSPMFGRADADRDYDEWVQQIADDRAADTDAWIELYQATGTIYPDLEPDALDEEFERLAVTADMPVIEPTTVLPPMHVMAAALDPGVAEFLSQYTEAADTFVRQLVLVPLGDVAGLFDRPFALPAGVS